MSVKRRSKPKGGSNGTRKGTVGRATKTHVGQTRKRRQRRRR